MSSKKKPPPKKDGGGGQDTLSGGDAVGVSLFTGRGFLGFDPQKEVEKVRKKLGK